MLFDTPSSLDSLPNVDALKRAFAAALLRHPTNHVAAAQQVVPFDMGLCVQIAQLWPFDDVVQEETQKLTKEKGQSAFLPGKADLKRKVWDEIQTCNDHEHRFKLMEFYGKMIGAIERPAPTLVNNGQMVLGAMVVKEMGTNADWENTGVAQQAALRARGLKMIEDQKKAGIEEAKLVSANGTD